MKGHIKNRDVFQHYRQHGDMVAYFESNGELMFVAASVGLILNVKQGILVNHGSWLAVNQQFKMILGEERKIAELQDVVSDLLLVSSEVMPVEEINEMLASRTEVRAYCCRVLEQSAEEAERFLSTL